MATLREAIGTILETDAKLSAAGKLGNASLLGRSGTSPYGVYFIAPPEHIELSAGSFLTYTFVSMTGRKPTDQHLIITAYGNNYETILARVYELIHEAIIVASDFTQLMAKWDFAGVEVFDDDFKCYKNQNRFLLKGWRT